MMMDPSYNFAYAGDDSEREENADSNGVVQGQYSYINAEGNEIIVRYKAGADIGFVVVNEEELNAAVRKATDDGSVAADARRAETNEASSSETSNSYTFPQASPLPIAAPDSLYGAPAAPVSDFSLSSYNEPSQPDTLYGAPSEILPIRNQQPPMVMDASFNFSIDESDHSFQESADQAGERTGSYSYINPDGDSIEVRYRAGRDGFLFSTRTRCCQEHLKCRVFISTFLEIVVTGSHEYSTVADTQVSMVFIISYNFTQGTNCQIYLKCKK